MVRRATERVRNRLHVLILFGFLFPVVCAVGESAFKGVRKPIPRAVREREELRLPDGATDVRRLGRGWHTFRLAVDGRPRRYLRRLSPAGATEAFVEVDDPVNP